VTAWSVPGASAATRDGWGATLAVILLVLLSSGNPAFIVPDAPEFTIVPAAIVLAIALLLKQRLAVRGSDAVVFGVFVLLTAVHLATVAGATLTSALGFFARLFVGYAVIRLVVDAPRLIVQVMSALAALGIAIYVIDQMLRLVGIDLASMLAPLSLSAPESRVVHVAFHNFNSPIDRHRNAGLFWEPGAFSGYCITALLLLAFARPHFTRGQYLRHAAVLTLGVLTSLSTTGYLILPAVLLVHVLRAAAGRGAGSVVIAAGIALPVFLVVGILSYELPFMRTKIEDQVFSVSEERGDWQITRFGTLIADMEDIAQRPLSGWGANPRVRPSQAELSEILQTSQGNGFTNWIVRYGLVGLLTFLFFTTRGLRSYGGTGWATPALASAILLLLLQGEMFLNYPLYLGLMFLHGTTAAMRVWVVPIRNEPSAEGPGWADASSDARPTA